MGLDVYVVKHDALLKMNALPDNASQEAFNEAYQDYKAGHLELEPTNGHNLFKLGYWRSSYNGGGINSILERTIGQTLVSVLSIDEGEEVSQTGHVMRPDWPEMLCRAVEIRFSYAEARARWPEDGEWYLQALDVVIETIEYVIRHEPETWAMVWSY